MSGNSMLRMVHDRWPDTRAVEAHVARQGRDPHNWGFIGDIGALELALTEARERVGR